jgi:hypothetical protein
MFVLFLSLSLEVHAQLDAKKVRNENLLSCAIRLLMKQHDLGLKIKCTGYLFFIPYDDLLT